jgi:hypothetical protein
MRKTRITDFDIAVGWRTPNYYRAVSEWVVNYRGDPLSEISNRRARGSPWSITILGFYIQINVSSIIKEKIWNE